MAADTSRRSESQEILGWKFMNDGIPILWGIHTVCSQLFNTFHLHIFMSFVWCVQTRTNPYVVVLHSPNIKQATLVLWVVSWPQHDSKCFSLAACGRSFFSQDLVGFMNLYLEHGPKPCLCSFCRRSYYPSICGFQPAIIRFIRIPTPQKFNIAPKIRQSPKETSTSNHQFSGAMLNFGGCTTVTNQYYLKVLRVVKVATNWRLGIWLKKSGSNAATVGLQKFVSHKSMVWVYHWLVVSNIFYVHPYLGKIPNLTNIVQMDWNHHLDGVGPSFLESFSQIETSLKESQRIQAHPGSSRIDGRNIPSPE